MCSTDGWLCHDVDTGMLSAWFMLLPETAEAVEDDERLVDMAVSKGALTFLLHSVLGAKRFSEEVGILCTLSGHSYSTGTHTW